MGVTADELSTAQVWSMDTASNWTVVSGTGTKVASTQRTEGTASLQLTSAGYVAVRGAVVDKPGFVSPLLAFDVMVPAQAGPNYFGAVQVQLNAPSLGIFSQWLSPPRDLNAPTGTWQTLYFQIPASLYAPILGSPFNDLQVTIGVNPAVNQPYRLDNLRFVPAPTCVGVPNGTLCDDSVTCTTGNTCNNEVCGSVNPVPPGSACDVGDDVLGFENTPAWRTTNGTATLAPSATRVQGQRSLSVTPRNGVTVGSIALKTLHKVSQTLSLRVQKPTNQPNPGWHGQLTLVMSSPSRGINYTQMVDLTGQPSGSFFELTFPVSFATYQTLATSTYSDLTFSISINPPSGQTGFYLLDDLRFVPVNSCAGALVKTACDDGSACTQGDACNATGTCGVTVNCNDDNVCTDDSCNPAVGCVITPNTAPCTDGNACTDGDRCSNTFCFPGAVLDCDDTNVCTDDACNPATGCTHTNNAAPCDDANACTDLDRCAGGNCQPGTPLSCSDGNVCTDDSCNPTVGCANVNNTGPCDDGNDCTESDVCAGGACNGAPVSCDDGSNCTFDLCTPGPTCLNVSKCDRCFEDKCCIPQTCESLFAECGVHDDQCGGTVDCSSSCPAGGVCNAGGRCLPPNSFSERSGVNVCETVVEAFWKAAVTHPEPRCKINLSVVSTAKCLFLGLLGHPECCFGIGECLNDPVCSFLTTVVDEGPVFYDTGSLYCDFRSPKEYWEKLMNGAINSLAEYEAMLQVGGLQEFYDFQIQVMYNTGRSVPTNVKQIIRGLTASSYDGGATGFAYEDLDNVRIVKHAWATALPYNLWDRGALTLGPVIIFDNALYEALFGQAGTGVTLNDFLSAPAVCETFIAAVDVLIHELVHVKQYRVLGQYNFLLQYVGSTIVAGLDENETAFEEEPFDYQIRLSEEQGGRYCMVMADLHETYIDTFTLETPKNTCPPDRTPTVLDALVDFPACP